MKQIISTLALAFAVAAAMSSCTSVADINIENAPVQNPSAINVDVKASLPGTRAGNDLIKSEWNSQDWIYVSSNGYHNYFKANEAGTDASFTISGNSANWSDGVAYAFFPKSIKLDNNAARFSFAGQTGLYEDLDRFNVMTSKSTVSNGSATFTFSQQTTVLAISKDVLYKGGKFSQIVISGENVSSDIDISVANGNVEINPAGNSDIVVNNPTVKDDMVFIALIALAGAINIDVFSTDGAHFFTTLDASDLVAGSVNSTENANWDGGIEITFNPSVESWN